MLLLHVIIASVVTFMTTLVNKIVSSSPVMYVEASLSCAILSLPMVPAVLDRTAKTLPGQDGRVIHRLRHTCQNKTLAFENLSSDINTLLDKFLGVDTITKPADSDPCQAFVAHLPPTPTWWASPPVTSAKVSLQYPNSDTPLAEPTPFLSNIKDVIVKETFVDHNYLNRELFSTVTRRDCIVIGVTASVVWTVLSLIHTIIYLCVRGIQWTLTLYKTKDVILPEPVRLLDMTVDSSSIEQDDQPSQAKPEVPSTEEKIEPAVSRMELPNVTEETSECNGLYLEAERPLDAGEPSSHDNEQLANPQLPSEEASDCAEDYTPLPDTTTLPLAPPEPEEIPSTSDGDEDEGFIYTPSGSDNKIISPDDEEDEEDEEEFVYPRTQEAQSEPLSDPPSDADDDDVSEAFVFIYEGKDGVFVPEQTTVESATDVVEIPTAINLATASDAEIPSSSVHDAVTTMEEYSVGEPSVHLEKAEQNTAGDPDISQATTVVYADASAQTVTIPRGDAEVQTNMVAQNDAEVQTITATRNNSEVQTIAATQRDTSVQTVVADRGETSIHIATTTQNDTSVQTATPNLDDESIQTITAVPDDTTRFYSYEVDSSSVDTMATLDQFDLPEEVPKVFLPKFELDQVDGWEDSSDVSAEVSTPRDLSQNAASLGPNLSGSPSTNPAGDSVTNELKVGSWSNDTLEDSETPDNDDGADTDYESSVVGYETNESSQPRGLYADRLPPSVPSKKAGNEFGYKKKIKSPFESVRKRKPWKKGRGTPWKML